MPTIVDPPAADEPRTADSTSAEFEDPNHPSNNLRSQAAEAYNRILTGILKGDFLPTEDKRSSEIALQTAYEFGSRMPIRMALAVLASEGLVAQRARQGFWVVDYTDHDLHQIGSMRADADAMVASFLGARIADGTAKTESKEFQRILDSLRRMDELADIALKEGDPSDTVDPEVEMEFADNDTCFHAFIAEATNYTLAARHIHQWRNLVRLYRVRHDIHYTRQDLMDICAEHNKLIDLVGLPIEECPAGIDAMIEQAATSHVAASLVRCKAGAHLRATAQAAPLGDRPPSEGIRWKREGRTYELSADIDKPTATAPRKSKDTKGPQQTRKSKHFEL